MDIWKSIENAIEPILQEDVDTRADDMRLYLRYVQRNKADIGKCMFERKYRLQRRIASYDSVSRIRRKLQQRDPKLRPSKEYIAARRKAEKEFRLYAKGVTG